MRAEKSLASNCCLNSTVTKKQEKKITNKKNQAVDESFWSRRD